MRLLDMNGILFFLFVISICYGIASLIYPKRRRNALFADREELTRDEIFSRYYKNLSLPKYLVLELWEDAAKTLRVSAGKLRPTDRLDTELGAGRFFPLVDLNEEFTHMVMKRLKKHNAKSDLSKANQIRSLNDYVLFFAKEMEKKVEKGDGSD